MKRLTVFLIVVMCFGSCLYGCTNDADKAKIAKTPASITVIEEPLEQPNMIEVASVVDNTAELKQKTYEALKGYEEGDFYTESGYFDIVAFAKAIGCSCRLSPTLDEIVIRPNNYNAENDFCMTIEVNAQAIVTGDSIEQVKLEDGWREKKNHYSATDFTTGLIIEDYKIQIGFDELDYIWCELRVLTAPTEKADEIRKEVSEEIASYYLAEG